MLVVNLAHNWFIISEEASQRIATLGAHSKMFPLVGTLKFFSIREI